MPTVLHILRQLFLKVWSMDQQHWPRNLTLCKSLDTPQNCWIGNSKDGAQQYVCLASPQGGLIWEPLAQGMPWNYSQLPEGAKKVRITWGTMNNSHHCEAVNKGQTWLEDNIESAQKFSVSSVKCNYMIKAENCQLNIHTV